MPTDNRPLATAQAEVLKCPRCGQCRSVCPVFGELGDEGSVARARIALAKALLEDKYSPDREAEQCLSECTLCMACVANCPSNVRVDSVVLAGRADLASSLGVGSVKGAVFKLLAQRQNWLPGLARLAATFQDIPFARLPEDSGLRLRFPVAGFDRQHVLPAVASTPLLRRLGQQIGQAERGVVAYFVGCYDNYLDTRAGNAAIAVLAHNGFRVLLPREQGCCAMPMLANGVRDLALQLMRRNVDSLLRADASHVVVGCASCGSALKHLYAETFAAAGDGQYAEKSAALGERVRDVSQFLLATELRQPEHSLALRVTYHDPCHLVRGQQVKAGPRELLRQLPGVDFVEMKEADRCCGGAGSFSFTHYELAKRINDRKIANIVATEAQVVATECPGCKLHLTDGIARHRLPLRVSQVMQLVAQAYGLARG